MDAPRITSQSPALRINPDVVLRFQVAIIAFIVSVDIIVYNVNLTLNRPLPRFMVWLEYFVSMDGEVNLPTWYISWLTGICGLLLWLLASNSWRIGDRISAVNWALLGSMSFMISLDEFAQLHEQAGSLVSDSWFVPNLPLIWSRPWIVPVFTGAVVFLLIMLPFLRKLPKPTLRRFVLAGAIYVSGAAGVELFTSWSRERLLLKEIQLYLPVLEETLEKLGFAIFLWAILGYMAHHFHSLEFAKESSSVESTPPR